MDKRNSHNLLTMSYLLVSSYRNYAVVIIDYLPIQNLLNILSNKSSVVTLPVISPK